MDDETVAFLESGCALIVGAVGPDGAPVATRGWGADVVDGEPPRLRLLVDADDEAARAALTPGSAVAVTGADVVTLRSLQVKGRVLEVAAAAAADAERADRFCEEFFSDITATDGTPRPVLDRIRPATHSVVLMSAEAWFDQTPGPGAGAARP